MINQGCEVQIWFVTEAGIGFEEAVRNELAQVSEHLISDDDFSRQSYASSE